MLNRIFRSFALLLSEGALYAPVMSDHHRCVALPYIWNVYDRAGFYHITLLPFRQ